MNFLSKKISSLLTITAWLEPEKVELVEEMIRDRLLELHCYPVTEAELARCKRLICNDYCFSTETPGQLAGLYGYYQTLAKAELSIIYPYEIQQFQAWELQRLASQYLSPSRYAVTVLKP